MNGVDQRKRPGVTVAGFLSVCGVLAAIVAAPWALPKLTGALGVSPSTYLATAVGAVLVGSVLMRGAAQPWRAYGRGLVIGGLFGLAVVLALYVLFLLTWSGF